MSHEVKVRFELGDIIIACKYGERWKSVMLCGGIWWDIAHLENVLKLYKEKGVL